MKMQPENINQALQSLRSASEELSGLLHEGSPEEILAKLHEREGLLGFLNHLAANATSFENEKSTIQTILEIDKRNTKLLDKRISKTYGSLTELIAEKRVVGNVKSLSLRKHKQLVDLSF
jgi:hypothetical protein